ncbi:DNA mismatch repair endonuclease MutH [Legionella impletisoli]|uniref:DNA mismatch repair protein MutH n=1 Tax=Legionella impletisoli TaxID=343510 RepID=A0A917JTK6_9GAMM|nr:DNA mismatch repair endonuclease MutH [Legionella impletisoli]GGI81476.1 DNA mismatch repair protein MutH [Legionella impletisoli]
MVQASVVLSEAELLERCQRIEGLTLAQLAYELKLMIPLSSSHRKGWIGQMVELVLGADAGSLAAPDFSELGIELKTLPLNHLGKPAESTFVTSISLLTIHQENWLTSQCFSKLKRVLWLPIESDKQIPFQERRIGKAILWSPNPEQEKILAADWNELAWMLASGQLEDIHAGIGEYLQVRPKAANKQSLCYGYDREGNKIQTLPRGFYLRSKFTASIL